MTLGRIGAGVVSGLLLVVACVGTAHAADAVPAVGECYQVTDKQTYDDYWPGGTAVPCATAHSFEVTLSSMLPADVNSVTFAQDHCGYLDVWKAAGVNQPKKAIVSRPLRLEAFYFVVRQPGTPASYICGIGPVELRGRKDAVLTSTRNPVAALTAAQKAALQYCSQAVKGAPLLVPATTVPCTRTPRWQVTKWILWDDLYSTYPGEAVLRARATKICGPGTVVSVPSPAVWPGGTHRSWCYKKHTAG
jgi:hypothetical protein